MVLIFNIYMKSIIPRLDESRNFRRFFIKVKTIFNHLQKLLFLFTDNMIILSECEIAINYTTDSKRYIYFV